jgi:hypothetical protein
LQHGVKHRWLRIEVDDAFGEGVAGRTGRYNANGSPIRPAV